MHNVKVTLGHGEQLARAPSSFPHVHLRATFQYTKLVLINYFLIRASNTSAGGK